MSSDLVTAVLCEEDLLGGEIEVFVRDDLVPALFCVEGDTVCGDAFMVGWVEDILWVFLRHKSITYQNRIEKYTARER